MLQFFLDEIKYLGPFRAIFLGHVYYEIWKYMELPYGIHMALAEKNVPGYPEIQLAMQRRLRDGFDPQLRGIKIA